MNFSPPPSGQKRVLFFCFREKLDTYPGCGVRNLSIVIVIVFFFLSSDFFEYSMIYAVVIPPFCWNVRNRVVVVT